MNIPQELKNDLRKNDIHPVLYKEDFFVIEVECHNCYGSGLVEDENGKEYECIVCPMNGRREVTIQEKQIGLNPQNIGLQLPIEIEVTLAFRKLVESAGGWVFCGEVYLWEGFDNRHGKTFLTKNEFNDYVDPLPF